MKKSEFGKGLCYCLGLFLAHDRMFSELREGKKKVEPDSPIWAECWFNASSDHFYDLQWQQAPKHLQKRLRKLQDKCLTWGHGFPTVEKERATEKDIKWALQEAKDLLRLIDKAKGVTVQKGEWE